MILRGPVSDAVLNAYVDGALSPDVAAALAARAATEQDLAARVARLHGLKAGVAGLMDALPAAPDLPKPDKGPRPSLRLALAVAACSILAILGIAVLGPSQGSPLASSQQSAQAGGDVQDSSADLRAYHDAWAHAAADNTPSAPDWLTDAMASAGLRLVHAAPMPDGQGVHLAFIGLNSCKISLFERPVSGSVEGVVRYISDGVQTAIWHNGSAAFTLVAREMNPQRFATISEALAKASQTRNSHDSNLLAALTEARQPCLG